MKVAEYLLQTLELCGVRKIFGNPGTTEIPLVRLCQDRANLRYVVALSEVAAVPMADGYARATRSLGVVNLHVAPGLGNGMGTLYTAGIAKTPLLVLVGGQDRRLIHTAPILYGPLEQMAASVCKQVVRLDSVADASANIRNALRSALTLPFGPVALICPPDLLELDIEALPARVEAPRLGALAQADAAWIAQRLQKARSPAFVAAEEVHWHEASADLSALAEAFDAPVYLAPYTGVMAIAASSPAFGGYLSPSFRSIGARLAQHDLLLFAGGRTLRTTLFSEPALAQPKIWLGDDPAPLPSGEEFERAHRVDLRQALASIRAALPATLLPNRATLRRWRPERIGGAAANGAALHPTRAVDALIESFPAAIVFDEAGLSTSDVRQSIQSDAGEYMTNGSGGIGWGLAAAVGGAIGRSDRQTIALIGDGSALYAAEALWSAGHQATRLLLVVLSNRRYATLNAAAAKLAGGALASFSLEPPVLDFSGLATLYGFDFVRVEREAALLELLRGLHGRIERNTLLELVLDPTLEPATASRHF